MPWVGFEPTISSGERPQAYALDRAATFDVLLADKIIPSTYLLHGAGSFLRS